VRDVPPAYIATPQFSGGDYKIDKEATFMPLVIGHNPSRSATLQRGDSPLGAMKPPIKRMRDQGLLFALRFSQRSVSDYGTWRANIQSIAGQRSLLSPDRYGTKAPIGIGHGMCWGARGMLPHNSTIFVP